MAQQNKDDPMPEASAKKKVEAGEDGEEEEEEEEVRHGTVIRHNCNISTKYAFRIDACSWVVIYAICKHL